jgi:hypothetical protein
MRNKRRVTALQNQMLEFAIICHPQRRQRELEIAWVLSENATGCIVPPRSCFCLSVREASATFSVGLNLIVDYMFRETVPLAVGLICSNVLWEIKPDEVSLFQW